MEGTILVIEVNKVSRWVPKDPRRHRNGGRSKVMHEARLGDLTVDGATATEAKTKLLEAADLILRGTYTPVVIRHGRWLAVIARQFTTYASTWGYQLLDLDELDGRKVIYASMMDGTREDAERAARRHMAQNCFTHENPYAGLELLDDPDDRRQYLSDASFQVRYRALVDAGFDGRFHETAGGLDRWPEHIDKPADLIDPLPRPTDCPTCDPKDYVRG